MKISGHDRDILRETGKAVADIAADPVNGKRREMWKRLNGLKPDRPMVYIKEIPWHEMDVDGELAPGCEDPFCRQWEMWLKQVVYQWRHFPGDMVVDPVIHSPLEVTDTGFGLGVTEDLLEITQGLGISAHHYLPQLANEGDLDRIRTPRAVHDAKASAETFEALSGIFEGVIPVVQRGPHRLYFWLWDILVRWWGVEELLSDLSERPEVMHKAIDRLTTAVEKCLDSYEELGVLSPNNGNDEAGSGGPGFTDELPGAAPGGKTLLKGMWGSIAGQILGSVSPAMHAEFGIAYESRIAARFGLNYYGCCEPLHDRLDFVAKIPNLRKISVSPWADKKVAGEWIGRRYVASLKPNPAFVGSPTWDLAAARADLSASLSALKGCPVEIVLKDISTVAHSPRRLWEWTRMASELAGG